MNARRKAPADALNVVTDYSWLTNRRAGSAPINLARFSSMPLQGDSGGAVGSKWCGTEETDESHGLTLYDKFFQLRRDWQMSVS